MHQAKPFLSLLIVFLLIFSGFSYSQESSRILKVSKISNPEKVRQISPGSRVKIRTLSGDIIKMKDVTIGENYLLSQNQDTIYFDEISILKAQRKLNKNEAFIGIPLLVTGSVASTVGLVASVMLYAIDASAAVFLIPVVGVAATVTGFILVGKKKYSSGKWRIFSETVET